MDKIIEKKPNKFSLNPYLITGVALALFIGIFAYASNQTPSGKTYNIDRTNLVITQVKQAEFSEYLPLRGIVEPEATIFIDAIDGGRVEQVFVQEGSQVDKGQPIIRLSNTGLQLNVLAREAEVSEQINNMRNTRLALEQNQLALKRDIIELDFEVLKLEKSFKRAQSLVSKQLISKEEFEQVEDELAFQKKYRETVRESQQKEALLQEQQLTQLKQSVATLENNLAISRASLDKLVIRAPSKGQLTFLDAKEGESKQNGQRIGQVDLIDQFKITAQVDEFYVSRVNKGQTATFVFDNKLAELSVSKIYPGIDNGTFKVDFTLNDKTLISQLRLGQSLQLKFNLSASESKLQLANGGFLQSSGGSWVFVVDQSGNSATKRMIQIGRKNPQSIEIISGLKPGERVITSSYASFKDAETIQLTNNS